MMNHALDATLTAILYVKEDNVEKSYQNVRVPRNKNSLRESLSATALYDLTLTEDSCEIYRYILIG